MHEPVKMLYVIIVLDFTAHIKSPMWVILNAKEQLCFMTHINQSLYVLTRQ